MDGSGRNYPEASRRRESGPPARAAHAAVRRAREASLFGAILARAEPVAPKDSDCSRQIREHARACAPVRSDRDLAGVQ